MRELIIEIFFFFENHQISFCNIIPIPYLDTTQDFANATCGRTLASSSQCQGFMSSYCCLHSHDENAKLELNLKLKKSEQNIFRGQCCSNLRKKSYQARVFILGWVFQPSRIFVGKARSLTKSRVAERCFTWVCSGLSHKHWTRL